MKRKISLLLVVVLIVATFAGCSFIVRDLEKDFAREVIVIESQQMSFNITKPVYDDYGENGEYAITDETVNKSYTYTSPRVSVYKSQLNNYVNNLLGEKLNSASNPQKEFDNAIDDIINSVKEVELTVIEADRLFYAGELYYASNEIEDIQRSVYSSINSGILSIKNSMLASKNRPQITEPSEEQTQGESTYPTKPEETVKQEYRPVYYYNINGSFKWTYTEPTNPANFWYDDWYLNSNWYIEDAKHMNSYPGFFGTEDERSLGREALNAFFNNIVTNFETYTKAKLIVATDAQISKVNEEIEQLREIADEKGIEYIYPYLGKSLLCKFLYGDSVLRSVKSSKLQNYITDGVSVSSFEVESEYERLLQVQKDTFTNLTNYDNAVKNNDVILYTPTNRYVFVKHILLQFSPEQKEMLEAERTRVGATDTKNKTAVELFNAYREQLTREIVVYDRVNGEDDLSRPKNAIDVYKEIKAGMERYKAPSASKYAERAFDDYIYAYNDDPGIFNNRYGYAVVFDPLPTDVGSWREEFAEGAKDFRRNGYTVGQLLDNYVITDEGIHIMYYASDPRALEEKRLTDYTTAGQYERIYDNIETRILSNKQSRVYDLYFANYIAKTKSQEWVTTQNKIINSYKNDLRKQIFG